MFLGVSEAGSGSILPPSAGICWPHLYLSLSVASQAAARLETATPRAVTVLQGGMLIGSQMMATVQILQAFLVDARRTAATKQTRSNLLVKG